MRIAEGYIGHLAEVIVRTLLDQGFVHPTVSREEMTRRISKLLLDNFLAEQALEEEAESLARQHARQMAGMDQRRIVQGIKERLAKERGFAL